MRKNAKGGMMRVFKLVSLMLIVMFIITACAGKGAVQDAKKVWYPEWWDKQDDPNYVNVYATGVKVSENIAYDAAKANAMLEAAQYVESYVKGMVKNFEEEVGKENPSVHALTSKVVKNISKAKFSNTSVTKREVFKVIEDDMQKYKVYVRVSIPKETVNKNMLNQIKKEEELYNMFKASQGFDELEKEIEKYDE